MGQDIIKTWIMLGGLIVSFIGLIISNYMIIKVNKRTTRRELDNMLFNLQKISFENPYLEDEYFISGWDKFKDSYKSKQIQNENEYEKYLRYEIYCEMLFNFLEESYNFFENEEKMLNYVAFDYWVRTHKIWWKNPLEDNSNENIYNNKVQKLIKKWIINKKDILCR